MKFLLTEQLATDFLTEYVNKLNFVYKTYVNHGFYNQTFYNFHLKQGNRFAKFDYFFDEYLPNKYLFFSIFYNVKFLNSPADDCLKDIAICLPINAIDVCSIKIDNIPNLPDVKKEFTKFMHTFFGDSYKTNLKIYLANKKNNERQILEENEKNLQNKIDYLDSFLDF